MKQIFEIKDDAMIDAVLSRQEYGTLALCADDKPYSVPLNFVTMDGAIYFHGGASGRKIKILKKSTYAAFSVVEAQAMIPSYFSSTEGLACPATQFFKSIMIEGEIVFVEAYEEKVKALEALMQKLQPEGRYRPLEQKAYLKAIHATTVYKLIPKERRAKFKFGQHLDQKRFDMILSHLEERGTQIDTEIAIMMRELRSEDAM